VNAVSNQQSYQSLEPLPIPEEHFTELIKLISRIALTGAIVAFCGAIGLGLGLAEMGFSVTAGMIGGAAVGVAVGLFFSYVIPLPSKIAKYRIDTLNNVYGQLGKDEKTEDKFAGLRNFLTYPLERFGQTYQNHMLHNAITFIGDKVHFSRRNDLKKVWKAFLEHLHHTKVINADGEPIELDFSIELDRLEGKIIDFQVQKLNPLNESDLEQILGLEKICMGKAYCHSMEYFKEELAKKGNGCVIARKKGSQEILGYGWYHLVEDKIYISGIGINPGATMRTVGDQLLHGILLELSSKKPIVQLQVRKSNPARVLYESWGFEYKEELPNYCPQDPPEDSILMELNWDKCQEQLQKAA